MNNWRGQSEVISEKTARQRKKSKNSISMWSDSTTYLRSRGFDTMFLKSIDSLTKGYRHIGLFFEAASVLVSRITFGNLGISGLAGCGGRRSLWIIYH